MAKELVYDKHFTLKEARACLPMLRHTLTDIRQIVLRLRAIGFDYYKGKYLPGFHPDTRDEFPADFEQLLLLIQTINELGIEIKGLESGLVDFPALRDNGEEVFLCWKIDEDDIEFWHSLDGGFKAREHIDDF